jgi:uncharacterized protein (TIGR00369 family)
MPFEEWSRAGVTKLVGIDVVEVAPDRGKAECTIGAQHHNPMGTVHAGILCDVADYAMGTAWASGVAEDESFTTIEIKMNLFRPVVRGRIVAEARVVRRGRTIGYVECDVTDEQGRLVARMGSTCMTLRGEQAAGR